MFLSVMKMISDIKYWFRSLFKVWVNEYKLVGKDLGVILFFFALPLMYPIVYTLIYNPEVVENVAMVVVDNSRTAESRQLVRMINASQYTEVVDYAIDLNEARTMMKERKCYGILVIPEDYARRLGRNEQAVLPIYCDMSLMLRYRSIMFAMTDISLQLGSDIRTEDINDSPVAFMADAVGTTVGTDAFFEGDTSQGFASFIMPGVIILIIQQSLILGVLMLNGGASERRRRNGGYDPLTIEAPTSARLIGRAICLMTIYIPMSVYVLHYIPLMFELPHIGSMIDYLALMLPMLLASIFLADIMQPLVTERESSMLVWVFTSVLFLFVSGLTWPRYAMNDLWLTISSLVPSSWGVQGFLAIDVNGCKLGDIPTIYLMLWALTVAYFIIAVIVDRRCRLRDIRRYSKPRYQER